MGMIPGLGELGGLFGNTMILFWVVFILVWCLVCPILSAVIASRKGYSGGAWFAISFFFGIIGLVAAVGLPDKRTQDALGKIAQHLTGGAPVEPSAPSKFNALFVAIPVLVVILILSAIAVPNFMAARSKSRSNACQANLRQIDLAIEQYAMDNLKSNGDICRITDIVPTYIRKTPECQCGGTYQSSGCPAGKFIVGKTPTCSIGDSSKCKGYPHILYQ